MAELRFPINERDHVLGEATARVTLVEYGDYNARIARLPSRTSSGCFGSSDVTFSTPIATSR